MPTISAFFGIVIRMYYDGTTTTMHLLASIPTTESTARRSPSTALRSSADSYRKEHLRWWSSGPSSIAKTFALIGVEPWSITPFFPFSHWSDAWHA